MSFPSPAPEQEILRWYTRALRIPRLIGKLPSGERIKGGPYRQSQVVGAGAILVVGEQTMRWWGHWGFFGNWAALLLAAAAVGIATKYVPIGTVTPLVMAGGALGQASRVRSGLWCGHRVQLPRQSRLRSRVTLTPTVLPTQPTAPPTTSRATPVADTPARPRAVSSARVPATPAGGFVDVESKLAALIGTTGRR